MELSKNAYIPVIDVFAGPGGLGEGFSALKEKAKHPFRTRALVHSRRGSKMSGIARFLRESCGFSLVVVEQAAEQRAAADRPDVIGWWGVGRWHVVLTQWHVAQ
jgi:hypothetical protein